MRVWLASATMALAVAAGLVGCGGSTEPGLADQQTDSQRVITSTGLADLEIGDTRRALERDQGLRQGPDDCAPQLPDHPSVSPIFDGERLVLLWADPPLHTPDGVSVGSPVEQVHNRYPDAEPLPAPAGGHQYDGLLVTVDDHAYLFLHDGQHVQKLIVGSHEHARLLFHEGFGTC